MNPDIIGTLYKNDSEYAEDGSVIKAPTVIPGFHVNFTEEVEAIEQYKCDPQPVTPYRVYAGQAPVCYVFPDEATFRGYFPVQAGDV